MKNNFSPPNVHNALTWGVTELKAAKIASARLDCLVLLESILGQNKAWLLAHDEHALTSQQHAKFNALVAKRSKHIPIAYLVGHKEFYGRNFMVSPAVLVPRPETEQLVELVLKTQLASKPLKVLDMGTGSGAIAVTLALERPSWSLTATDVSSEALELAHQNALTLGANKRITFREQNLFHNDTSNYDVVVANLPYVPLAMHGKPDIGHEPELALFAGDDGLGLYRQFFSELSDRSSVPSALFTESLTSQHAVVAELASKAGYTLVASAGLIQQLKPL